MQAKELTADLVRQLRNLKDPKIDSQVQKLWGVARETQADKLKEIAAYKSLIQSKGTEIPQGGEQFSAGYANNVILFLTRAGKSGRS